LSSLALLQWLPWRGAQCGGRSARLAEHPKKASLVPRRRDIHVIVIT
jgi:hypothetical protein